MGLQIDYFYSLTLRQFANICAGYFKKKKFEQNSYLLGVRKIMYSTLLPYQKKGFKEQDLFRLEFEEIDTDEIDLYNEIESVKSQKEFWEEMDKKTFVVERVVNL